MKVKEYIKKHYAIFIPIILIAIFILTYAIYTIQKLYNNYSTNENQNYYTYFAGVKVEDDFNIKLNRKKEIIELSPTKEIKLNTIIYNGEKNKAIFPNDMTIVLGNKAYAQLKVNKYTSLTYDESNTRYLLKTTDYEKELNNFFLYDGIDLYFFPESTVLSINEEKILLSPMSFVKVNNNNSLEYYDIQTDKYIVKEIKNEKIMVTSNTYRINLNEDKLIRLNKETLLIQPRYLNLIK